MNDSDILEIQINNIIMNTPYSREVAIEKLQQLNNCHIKVIKDYITNVKPCKLLTPPQVTNTVNQEIFAQCRHLLDTSMLEYNERTKK
mgnify:CR=1 FL=1